ncbi:MAG: glutamyl-tRNA reductase [Elusimicrobia bacterium]|nr:glutamyl-tRNA reductase [Elusimicrobiota bacterium]
MELVLVGISHKTCPVETREAFSITPERRRLLLRAMLSGGLAAEELVWVSTCNRVDLYAVGEKRDCETALIGFLSDPAACLQIGDLPSANKQAGGAAPSLYDGNQPAAGKAMPAPYQAPPAGVWRGLWPSNGHLYSKTGKEALDHLLSVACGLDSMVVGENEILGQLKDSYYAAKSAGTTGRLTNMLFQRAIGVGKHVRANTKISQGGRSVAFVAVQYAGRIFGDLANARVLLLGAGELAEAAASVFAEKKAGLTVINRTHARAQELAAKFSAQCLPWESLEEALAVADVALVSTASPEPVITKDLMKKIMALRHGNPVFLVDISVPRNIQPEAGGLSNVYLYNIDDLERIVAENLAQLSGEIKKAREIIDAKGAEIWDRFSQDSSVDPAGFTGPLVIGTRGSRLARAQTDIVCGLIRNEGIAIEQKVIKTGGDIFLDESAEKLIAADGKGLFIKEIERDLLDGGIKLAMHSLKDLPGELAEGLLIAAHLKREDPRDAIITRSSLRLSAEGGPPPIQHGGHSAGLCGGKLADLPAGSRIATGSLRRRFQIAKLKPDAVFVPMRGNMDTRLAKLERGDCDALVVAVAALKRLGLEKKITQIFSVDEVVPAPGQGVIVVEACTSDLQTLRLARRLDHPRTRLCAECERMFLAALGGGCATPLGAYADLTEEGLLFKLFWSDAAGAKRLNYETIIDCSRISESITDLAARLKQLV